MNSQPLAISTYRNRYVFKRPCFLDCIIIHCYLRRLLGSPNTNSFLQVAPNPDSIGGEIEKPRTAENRCQIRLQSGGMLRNIQSILRYNEEIKEQDLKPVIQRKKRYSINTRTIVQARRDRHTIEVTMLEGEVFRGLVDWVSRYEIKMILENESKIVVFSTCYLVILRCFHRKNR